MSFDSVFNGDPTTPGVSASGKASLGVNLATGQLYVKDDSVAGWQKNAGSGSTSDNITNESTVTGTTVTDALNTLNSGVVLKTLISNISSSQLNNILSNPVQLLTGVTGKYFSPQTAIMEYTFVATPYTVSGGGALNIGSGGNNGAVAFAGFIDQSVDMVVDLTGQFTSGSNPQTTLSVADQPITLFANGEVSVSGGGGTLKITLQYIEYTL